MTKTDKPVGCQHSSKDGLPTAPCPWAFSPSGGATSSHGDNSKKQQAKHGSSSHIEKGEDLPLPLPKPQSAIALPLRLDTTSLYPSSSVIATEFHAACEPAPLWREKVDPALEDVYWMVEQLVAGRRFAGFPEGAGFGGPPAVVRDENRGGVMVINHLGCGVDSDEEKSEIGDSDAEGEVVLPGVEHKEDAKKEEGDYFGRTSSTAAVVEDRKAGAASRFQSPSREVIRCLRAGVKK